VGNVPGALDCWVVISEICEDVESVVGSSVAAVVELSKLTKATVVLVSSATNVVAEVGPWVLTESSTVVTSTFWEVAAGVVAWLVELVGSRLAEVATLLLVSVVALSVVVVKSDVTKLDIVC